MDKNHFTAASWCLLDGNVPVALSVFVHVVLAALHADTAELLIH